MPTCDPVRATFGWTHDLTAKGADLDDRCRRSGLTPPGTNATSPALIVTGSPRTHQAALPATTNDTPASRGPPTLVHLVRQLQHIIDFARFEKFAA
jgi:hypothetical protein